MGSPATAGQFPRITVLAGPTASGKTALSLELARLMNAEIISADSRQVYRGMNIGTAKPGTEERAAVPHHGIDICDITETYTVGRFFRDACGWIDDIRGRGKQVLVVGGSGLYIRALTDGLFDGPEADPQLRAELEARARKEGLNVLVDELLALDPGVASFLDPENPVRVIRALEVCIRTGERYSELRSSRMPTQTFDVRMLGLRWERSVLYDRIDQRVDSMLTQGLIDEVRNLLAAGAHSGLTALNTVGYKEVIAYLASVLTYDEMVEAIKRNTRRYARRQLTWFRKETRLQWTDMTGEWNAADVATQWHADEAEMEDSEE
ncbi:MAG: tRNA (adenosine(37)-N6)-dimethylallyltransferase MiaA [Bacteroidetes bacterium]|nr:tRNA (adenosine(37)-N6)-dimethylallyltransferase MiaA [Bacteroidota bacterium]